MTWPAGWAVVDATTGMGGGVLGAGRRAALGCVGGLAALGGFLGGALSASLGPCGWTLGIVRTGGDGCTTRVVIVTLPAPTRRVTTAGGRAAGNGCGGLATCGGWNVGV